MCYFIFLIRVPKVGIVHRRSNGHWSYGGLLFATSRYSLGQTGKTSFLDVKKAGISPFAF